MVHPSKTCSRYFEFFFSVTFRIRELFLWRKWRQGQGKNRGVNRRGMKCTVRMYYPCMSPAVVIFLYTGCNLQHSVRTNTWLQRSNFHLHYIRFPSENHWQECFIKVLWQRTLAHNKQFPLYLFTCCKLDPVYSWIDLNVQFFTFIWFHDIGKSFISSKSVIIAKVCVVVLGTLKRWFTLQMFYYVHCVHHQILHCEGLFTLSTLQQLYEWC